MFSLHLAYRVYGCNITKEFLKKLDPMVSWEMSNMALFYMSCAGGVRSVARRYPINVKWSKPMLRWHKLNTDGSALGNPGLVGGGGIIRDHNGMWVWGFSRAIETASSVEAELWALRDGLKLCISLNLQAVEIDLDAKVVVDWVSGSACSNCSLSSHFGLQVPSQLDSKVDDQALLPGNKSMY